MTFACRSCASASNNPFGNSDRLLLWVKDTSSSGSSAVVPPLRVRRQGTSSLSNQISFGNLKPYCSLLLYGTGRPYVICNTLYHFSQACMLRDCVGLLICITYTCSPSIEQRALPLELYTTLMDCTAACAQVQQIPGMSRSQATSWQVLGARPQVSIGDYDNKRYCSSVQLQSLTAAQTSGAYAQFSIPLSSFACPFPTSQASQVRLKPYRVCSGQTSQVNEPGHFSSLRSAFGLSKP